MSVRPKLVLLVGYAAIACGAEEPSTGRPSGPPGPLPLAEVSCEVEPCVREVAAGYWHVCARLDGGEVYCWGANADGATGQPMRTPETDLEYDLVPVSLAGIRADRISADGTTTCVQLGGAGQCWGYSVHLHHEGDPMYWELQPQPVAVPVEPLAQVVTGAGHTCALAADGVPHCVGLNYAGQLGRVTEPPANLPPNWPRAVMWPGYEFEAAQDIEGVHRLAATNGITCGIWEDATARCWGDGQFGMLGPEGSAVELRPLRMPLERVNDISLGDLTFGCALLLDGTAACWGRSRLGSAGTDSGYVWPPRRIEGIAGAVQIAAGSTHACAVLQSGEVACWGSNNWGQLGIPPDTAAHVEPVLVSGIGDAVQVEAGNGFSCAVLRAGRLLCWGTNASGQLGIGVADDVDREPVEPHWPERAER